VQRFIRVEYADGVPFAVLFNYMHPNLGRKIARNDVRKNSMLECLLALNVEFGNVRHSIQARMPDEEVAILLQIDLTEPTLFWQEQMFDASNRPLHLWTATAAIGALVVGLVAALLPDRWMCRFWSGWLWVIPCCAMIECVYLAIPWLRR
jgi:hypothetical protein